MSNLVYKHFSSAHDFIHWLENAPIVWRRELASMTTCQNTHEFSQTKDLGEAIKLAKYGWAEGLKLLVQEVKGAEENLQTPDRPMKKFDVAGVFPHPARAAAGDAFSMVVKGRQKKAKPVLKIANRMTFSSHVKPDKVMMWGAAICSYVNMLEREGYAVELKSSYQNKPQRKGPNVAIEILLKQPEHPLSMSSLVFWWAHPSSLRRIKFAAFERMDIEQWYGGHYIGGYGVSADVLPVPEDTLYLTIDDAGNTIKESLKAIEEKHREILISQNINLPRFFSAAPNAKPRQGGLSRR